MMTLEDTAIGSIRALTIDLPKSSRTITWSPAPPFPQPDLTRYLGYLSRHQTEASSDIGTSGFPQWVQA